jgi:hypothetical protein
LVQFSEQLAQPTLELIEWCVHLFHVFRRHAAIQYAARKLAIQVKDGVEFLVTDPGCRIPHREVRQHHAGCIIRLDPAPYNLVRRCCRHRVGEGLGGFLQLDQVAPTAIPQSISLRLNASLARLSSSALIREPRSPYPNDTGEEGANHHRPERVRELGSDRSVASISPSSLATCRRASGCIVRKSMMSAQSCPFWSR